MNFAKIGRLPLHLQQKALFLSRPGRLVKERLKAIRTLTPLDFPNVLHIELTSMCNLRCEMCPHIRMKREKKHMDLDLFKKLVDSLPPKKVDVIALYFFGEPLLYPHLVEAIHYLKTKRPEIYTFIRTNAQLLKEDLARNLLNSGLDSLQFSIEGANKQTYEKIMTGASYDEMLTNLETYLNLKKQTNSRQFTTILTLRMPETENEIPQLIKKWKHLVNSISIMDAHDDYKVEGSLSNTASDPAKPIRTRPCPDPFYHAMIYSNGEVGVCCIDCEATLALGNLSDPKATL